MVLAALPPHDIPAEEAVIASILVDDDAIFRVQGLVQSNDFFREKNGLIYAAQLALAGRGEPCNPVMVANELNMRGQLDLIGGLAYLSQITADLPTAVGCEFYARIVARDATYRRLISALGRSAQKAYEGGQDVESTIASIYADLRQAEGISAAGDWESAPALVDRFGDEILRELADPASRSGIPTRLLAVDRHLDGGGLIPGGLYVVCSVTSGGKTTFTSQVLQNIALQGIDVGLVSVETTARQIIRQIAYRIAGIDRQYYLARGIAAPGDVVERMSGALDWVRVALPTLHIDARPGLTPNQIRLAVARLHSQTQGKLRVVAVDYLHRLNPDPQRKGENRERELSAMVQSLGQTAMEFEVALLLNAQLNRYSLGKDRAENGYRPTIGDLHGSSDIEKFAFVILGLHRHDWYAKRGYLKPKPELENTVEVLGLKAQSGADGWSALLRFDAALGRVEDRENGQ